MNDARLHPINQIYNRSGLFLVAVITLSAAMVRGVMAADEEPTPLAGETFHTEVLGEPVKVPPRDRKKVTAASFGMSVLPEGPKFYQVLPFGALYLWRNSDDMRQRFRATLSGPVNDVNMNVGSHSSSGWELRFTLI